MHHQKFRHMQPPCLQLGCNYRSHATMQGFLCNCNGYLPPFWVCMQLWCNYDHLHPNLWMISMIYYRIYLICTYSQLHVQPKQANYGLLVIQVHISYRHVQDQGCLQMIIPFIRFRIQLKNNLIYFATYLKQCIYPQLLVACSTNIQKTIDNERYQFYLQQFIT